MLKVKKLTLYKTSLKGNPLLSGLNFTIPIGTCFGLVGPSGCGKSTILRTIASLHPYWEGEVTIDGKTPRKSVGSVQMVFQDPLASLHPRHNVYQTLREPLRIQGRAVNKVAIENALISVTLSKDLWLRYPHELSGGQRQRLSIARSLIVQPKLLLLDECTASLDVITQMEILLLLKTLQHQYQMTMLLVSHNPSVVRYMCTDFLDIQSD